MNKKAGNMIISLVIIVVLGGLIYLHFNPSKIPDVVNTFNKTINNIIGNQTAQTNYTRGNYTKGILPNPALSPGDVLTNNLTIICVSGYSTSVRDVSQSTREQVFAEYNVYYPQPTGNTELDHIVPLCLGGSNDIKNLFVQFENVNSDAGYHEKDKLENYLCDHVCSGEINISYAQDRIAKDWYSYYREVYNV